MKRVIVLSLFVIMGALCLDAKQPVDYVNPIIGAITYGEKSKDVHGFGKTFPGTATPFGLVQLSPDTITGGDNGPGYSYAHKTIEGFSFTHMSGIGWYGDMGNFLVMPTTGALKTSRGKEEKPEDGYRSRFSHDTEEVKAGYYAVTLDDYNVRTELTCAARAGIIKFTFPENKQSRIQIDLSRRVGGTSTEQYVKVVDDRTISGWMKCPPEGGGWGNGNGKADYTVYFYCQFSKPLKKFGVWEAEMPDGWVRKRKEIESDKYQAVVTDAKITYCGDNMREGESPDEPAKSTANFSKKREFQGKHLGFFSEFATKKGEKVLLKSGISFVSASGAKANLESDIPHWSFDRVYAMNRDLWSKAFANLRVEGGTEDDKIKFYTAIYHTMIDPRSFSDVNGEYIGADGKVHKTSGFTYRTLFSGWDVFRSQFPIQTIINPGMVNDTINSLMQMAELSDRGYLPRWEIVNAYSGCMLGNPAVSVIVDAYEKGIRGYDVDKAFELCKNSVDRFGNGEKGFTPGSLSRTLEYAYSDWCLGRFAESLCKTDLAKEYYAKSKAYKKSWNPEVKWFQTKNAKGEWTSWKGKTTHGQGCTESNPFQQGWFVPHDITGMMELMGRDFFKEELVSFFDNTPDDFTWNDYYNHANEPVHHIPFMFNEAGMPWLTQKWTRKICENAYGTDVFGICGNEDVGQMSAWYVLAAMGIHPICPGDGKYQITSPVFSKVTVGLDPKYYKGGTFTVIAKNNSEKNVYIQSVKLNGKELKRFWISHAEIAAGGVLELEMGERPH